MLDGNKVIRDVLRFAEESGAGLTKFVGRKQDNTPLYAVLVIRGAEETAEILGAVEAIEARWDAEDEPKSEPESDPELSPVVHQANLMLDPASGKLVLAPWVTAETESRLDDPASEPESEPASDSPSSPASRCSRALGDDFGRET
jgi:hypothetical protein